jgi:hypothetical protein
MFIEWDVRERRSVEVKHVSPLFSACFLSVATPHPLNARTCPTKINQISAKLGARNASPGSLAAINSFQFDGLIVPDRTNIFDLATHLQLTISNMFSEIEVWRKIKIPRKIDRRSSSSISTI